MNRDKSIKIIYFAVKNYYQNKETNKGVCSTNQSINSRLNFLI